MYIQCCSNLGQFLIGMHCFNTGSLCYLSVDVFENWIYFSISNKRESIKHFYSGLLVIYLIEI